MTHQLTVGLETLKISRIHSERISYLTTLYRVIKDRLALVIETLIIAVITFGEFSCCWELVIAY